MRKHLKDHAQVAHYWAHQTQPEGQAGNLFYDGKSIFSFGRHFEIARLVERVRWKAVLFTTGTYSGYTSAHKNLAHSAIKHLTIFKVPLDEKHTTPTQWLQSYRDRLEAVLIDAARPRVQKHTRFERAKEIVAEANRFAEFFDLKARLSLPDDIGQAITLAQEEQQARALRDRRKLLAAESKRRKRIEAEKAIFLRNELPAYRRWEKNYHVLYGLTHYSTDFLRISKAGKEVETTSGASIPIEHAKRAYRVLSKLREECRDCRRDDLSIRIGHYSIECMTAEGTIVAGCHTIPWSEIEWLAEAAGWTRPIATANN